MELSVKRTLQNRDGIIISTEVCYKPTSRLSDENILCMLKQMILVIENRRKDKTKIKEADAGGGIN